MTQQAENFDTIFVSKVTFVLNGYVIEIYLNKYNQTVFAISERGTHIIYHIVLDHVAKVIEFRDVFNMANGESLVNKKARKKIGKFILDFHRHFPSHSSYTAQYERSNVHC